MKKIILMMAAISCLAVLPVKNDAAVKPRLIGGHMSVSWLIYAVAPDSLIAWNSMPGRGDMEKLFLNKRVRSLGSVGSRTMGGMNAESLLVKNPTAIVLADFVGRQLMSKEMLKNANVQLLRIRFETFEEYPEAIRQIGKAAHAEKRADHLARFVEKMLGDLKKKTASIPESKRMKVYYASSPNGLETAAGNTVHDYVINYAGGINAFPPDAALNKYRFKVSLEQIMEYDPDVILVTESEFFKKIKTLPGWDKLRAVKSGRVYLMPSAPVCWMDRPVSMFQLMGAWWLASKLYPSKFPEGYRPMAEKFFKEFLNVKLDEARWKCIESEGR